MAGSTTLVGDANQQLRTLSRYLKHPEFNELKRQNDIAIVHWEEPLIFGYFVQPIALTLREYAGLGDVSGWGWTRDNSEVLSNTLRTATVPLLSNEICNGPSMHNGTITADMLCAGLAEGGRGACGGDR